MDTNDGTRSLFKEEVCQMVGSAIEVLNKLGHGLGEKPYKNSLVTEFNLPQISYNQQPDFDVLYKGHKVGAGTSRSQIRVDSCSLVVGS